MRRKNKDYVFNYISTHFITRKYASIVRPKRHTWVNFCIKSNLYFLSPTTFSRDFFVNKRLQKFTKKCLRGFQNQSQTFYDLSKVIKTLIPM